MSDVEKARYWPAGSPRAPRSLNFTETAFVAVVAYTVFMLASPIPFIVMYSWTSGSLPSGTDASWSVRLWEEIGAIAAGPPAIAVVWIAIRLVGRGFAEYLALNWPSVGQLVRALATMAVLVAIEMAIAYGGESDASGNAEPIVRGAGAWLIVIFSACIAGPVLEEFIVRGFMFRGWSESFLGPIGAIVLSSAVWAMSHIGYGWSARLIIFINGLALAHFRYRSNSTWLPVAIHFALNVFILSMQVF